MWQGLLLHFLGGLVFANGVPHFVKGISGEKFQSPFAKPPGRGESSPLVNVAWGFANLVAGYALATWHPPSGSNDIIAIAAGVLVMGVILAVHFGRVKGNV